MLRLAEVLPPQHSILWTLAKQCGIDYAVGTFDWSGGLDVDPEDLPWSFSSLARVKAAYEAFGFRVEVLENRPPLDKAKLGLPGRDEEIEAACDLIKHMGALKIPVWCYEWMPVFNWMRTSKTVPSRGGAVVTGYDHSIAQAEPLTEYGEVSEERLWENLQYFLERVVPVAEESGVKLAMHPDDPPLSPIRGLGRIMRSVENFQRLLDLVPSPVNGITMCQGNFALMTDDVPEVIRHFGAQGKIFFVHMRDVRGTAENFVETFHDDGQTDMLACMKAYRDIGFDGLCRPDHVPTMLQDSNESAGYSSIGRLFALGYLKGLKQAVYAEQ